MPRMRPFDQYVTLTTDVDGRSLSFEVLWNGERAVCNKCGAEIGWGLSAKRKWVPFNLDGTSTSHFSTCKPSGEADL